MKLKELNAAEMKVINGGGLLGGNDSSNDAGLFASIAPHNLLHYQTESWDGDEYSSNSIHLIDGFGLNVGGMLSSITS